MARPRLLHTGQVVEMIEENPSLLASELDPEFLTARMVLSRSEWVGLFRREPSLLLQSNAFRINHNLEVLARAVEEDSDCHLQVRDGIAAEYMVEYAWGMLTIVAGRAEGTSNTPQ